MLLISLSGMTQQDVDCLPVGVSLPFRETILHCRCNPPSDWSEQEYNLIGEHCVCVCVCVCMCRDRERGVWEISASVFGFAF